MTNLNHILFKMPDGWGESYRPCLHPSGCRVPSDPRSFMFAVRLGWVKPSFSEALRAGDLFHAVMENYLAYPESDIGGICHKVRMDATEEIETRQEELLRSGVVPPSGDEERKATSLGVMLGQIFLEMFPYQDNWTTIAVEQAFKLSLSSVADGLAGKLLGKVDAVIRLDDKDEYWLIDHKSTGVNPTIRARGLTFDTQAKLYRLLWDTAHPDKPLRGVIHNIIQKPSIRQKKNESFDDYLSRCFQWYEDRASLGPTEIPVRQSWVKFPVSRPPHKDEELIEMLRQVCPWYTCKLSLDKFYRTGYHHTYTQFNRMSPYMDLLEMHPAGWYDHLISHGFVKRHPDSRYETDDQTT